MDKIAKHIKDQLWAKWSKACNNYLYALAKMWEWDIDAYGFWVGDEIGGIFAYGDHTFMSMDNIIYCVENDVDSEQFQEWVDYCIRCDLVGITGTPNFRAWHEGCPRLSEERLSHLEQRKTEMDEAIKRLEEEFGKTP